MSSILGVKNSGYSIRRATRRLGLRRLKAKAEKEMSTLDIEFTRCLVNSPEFAQTPLTVIE